MASKKHQFILGLIIKRMTQDGFTVKCIDGKYNEAFSPGMQIPPKLLRHIPDAIGINQAGTVAIGEAKTESDIQTARTKEQLFDYSDLILNNEQCTIYIGIPKSAKEILTQVLTKLGLIGNSNIVILSVPNEIINE